MPSRSAMALAHEPWGSTVPLVKAYDMAYVRLSVPDLDVMHTFIESFGLHVVHRDDDCIYSRGLSGDRPFVHVVHRGPPKFLGFAFMLRSEADLHTLAAKVHGCSAVENLSGIEGRLSNGAGKRVRFLDPVCGFIVEAVHGLQADELPSIRPRLEYNYGGVYNRLGRLQDVGNRKQGGGKPGVPEVRRLGHVVFSVEPQKVVPMVVFFHNTFGLKGSDTNLNPKGKIENQFLHMDRGMDYSDHHSIFVLPGRRPGSPAQISHIAFEVQSIDDVFRGHFTLKTAKNEGQRIKHAWGIGRHIQGSQVYDYWFDPWGHVHEHWCDGDQVNDDHAHRVWKAEDMDGPGDQWGPTEESSTVVNLCGPDSAPYFKQLSQAEQKSILSRDLVDCSHMEVVRDVLGGQLASKL